MKALLALMRFNTMIINKLGITFLMDLQYYLLLNIEVFILFNVADYLLLKLQVKLNSFYDDKKRRFLSSPKNLIRFIRGHYLITKIINTVRPNYTYGYKSNRDLYESIIRPALSERVLEIIIFFLRPSLKNIVALILLLLLRFDFSKYFLDYSWIFSLEINNEKVASFLEITVPMLTVALVIFAWRYTGERGQLIRTLAQANRNHFEKVIDFHRKIKTNIADLIFHAPDNIEYALMNRENIIRCKMYMLSPFFDFLDNKIIWNDMPNHRHNIELTLFEDIDVIKSIYDKLIEAKKMDIYYSILWFLRLKYDLRCIYALPIYGELSNFERDLNLCFFTQKGYEYLLTIPDYKKLRFESIQNSPPDEADRENIEDSLIEEKVYFEKKLDGLLIKGIETLVKLQIYYDCSFRLLSIESNKFDRLLNYIFDRE
jgi:hypothetical protein